MGKEDNWLWLTIGIALLCIALMVGGFLHGMDKEIKAFEEHEATIRPFEEWVGEDFEDNPGPDVHWDPVTKTLAWDNIVTTANSDADWICFMDTGGLGGWVISQRDNQQEE